MTAVMIEITPPPSPGVAENPDAIVLVDDIDTLTTSTASGCNDDNPYK
ncbi:hypothetical protein [Streptomyces rhizosphaerihabitans]|nr:hypothetical protein [Streptomyces rhizosphaerihabitans]MCT9010321.1 hypothetical protein [Streptomyces rhizosphaerihabitans]